MREFRSLFGRHHRIRIGVAAAAVFVAIVAPGNPSAGYASSTSLPPHGIYTCSWVASHPAAAADARVTCDPAVFFSAQPNAAEAGTATGLGDLAPPALPDANGCQPVPNDGGRVGKGVYAWSTYEY